MCLTGSHSKEMCVKDLACGQTQIFFFLMGAEIAAFEENLPPQKLRRGKSKMDRPIEDEEFCPVLSQG